MEERIIVVKGQAGIEVRFALNESQAAADLWSQLPLTVEVEDFSTNEKTFYPDRLDTSDAPLARGGGGVPGVLRTLGRCPDVLRLL